MPAFRPYGSEDLHLISDLSRFDYEQGNARRRSRNTTPTEFSSSKLTLDTIIPLYSSKIDDGGKYSALSVKDLPPQPQPQVEKPPRHLVRQIHHANQDPPLPQIRIDKVRLPKKISIGVQVGHGLEPNHHHEPSGYSTGYLPKQRSMGSDLPAMAQPQDVFGSADPPLSISSRQKQLEHGLIKSVMNRPLIKIKGERFGPNYQDKQVVISFNFFLYLLEVSSSIIEIVIASVLLSQDPWVNYNIYRYFIADGSITLAISGLFLVQLLDYEKRNGSFYCLAASIMKMVSFILIVSNVFPESRFDRREIWDLRRTVGAFIIISTFLWVVNLVMFLTTLYISRLNLLDDLNFDYSSKGLSDEFNKPKPKPIETEDLQEFYLNENGEMYAVTEDWEKDKYRKNNKILVYTF